MHPHRHHKLGAGILLATTGASLALAAATLGAPARAGGPIQLFITPSLTGRGGGSVLITGAVGDYGRATKVNAAGKPDPTGGYSLVKLRHGSVLINATELRKQIQAAMHAAQPDLASCSLQGSVSAPISIVGGSGQYAAISGTGSAAFTFAELGARYTHGPHKGACNLTQGPVAQWASITGNATVGFG
jgi:hypothetical protein